MKCNLFLSSAIAATAVAALAVGAASAQSVDNKSVDNNRPGDRASAQSVGSQTGMSADQAVSANQNGQPASADLPPADAVSSGQVSLQSSPTAADQAYTLKAGDPNVVSNAPIPDTPAARHQFGQPMSRAGKMTRPIGD